MTDFLGGSEYVESAIRELTLDEARAILGAYAKRAAELQLVIMRTDPTFDFTTMKWTHERQDEAKP